jgi:hypothetical protein
MAKVIAPNKKFTGEAYGVQFFDGIAETDDTWKLNILAEVGCTIEKKASKPKKKADEKANDEKANDETVTEDETNTEE